MINLEENVLKESDVIKKKSRFWVININIDVLLISVAIENQ